MTPSIREAINLTSSGFEGFSDWTRIAVLSITVSIAFNPAAFIVSPDSDLLAISPFHVSILLTNEIDNSISYTKSTSCLNTSTKLNNLCL